MFGISSNEVNNLPDFFGFDIYLDGKTKLNKMPWHVREPFKVEENGNVLLKFELKDVSCELLLIWGKIMVDKFVTETDSAQGSKIIIYVGCAVGIVVVAGMAGFLIYWCFCRKKKDKEKNLEGNKSKTSDKTKKLTEREEEVKNEMEESVKHHSEAIWDETMEDDFDGKQDQFVDTIQKYFLNLKELGSVYDFICLRRNLLFEYRFQAMDPEYIKRNFNFFGERIIDPSEFEMLKENSINAAKIIQKLGEKANEALKPYKTSKYITTELREYVKNPTTPAIYQAVLFEKEYCSELRVINQIHDVLEFPIQVHLLYLFDKQMNEDFRIYGITFLKYRILRQIKVVPKESLSLVQWPMNAYGKWFHENPSLFYLAEDELEDLKAEIKRQSPDIATDFNDVKEFLVPKEQSCV